jgi:hypothetical protein
MVDAANMDLAAVLVIKIQLRHPLTAHAPGLGKRLNAR